ncbi:DUF2304 domain-containing protein [Tahibacter amnicola]|uniref:DUF2304 domain-containing protein n=1 Tax=Tahibacter amnicola TaxID=2976241 RepID=A0ABY6BA62_9GAMM|nr:DUF2304 domain-containing protein [Tahibacter amnicola]MCU7375992.1 DUF2304 domain-containing protein [Paucibacter sp. O1-1]MDA3831004.1 DUF2304 domain-containing protein [Paucibacter sp. O1-1]UXI66951.1 DUF2304 domain-containing protein [Tahibacter amnicola]
MSAQITAAIIGLLLAGSILYLVRRDHLHGPYALWWLVVAAATLVISFVPRTIDWLAHLTGIAYPPVLPIIIGLSLILLRMLQLDIERSRQERQLRRLNQKLAILEEELITLHRRLEDRQRPGGSAAAE